MPKNKGKGGKNRRRGKNENEETKRQLEFKEPGQEYAQVVRMLGNGRCECYCFDGQTRLGHIRGKMRKKASARAERKPFSRARAREPPCPPPFSLSPPPAPSRHQLALTSARPSHLLDRRVGARAVRAARGRCG